MKIQTVLMAASFALFAVEASSATEDRTGASRPLETARAVADWQLNHMEDFSYVRSFQRHTEQPLDWIQATFFIGLTHLADATGDARYADAVVEHGRENQWALDDRPRHADSDAIGAVWVWAARRDGEPARLDPLRRRFEEVLAAPSEVGLAFEGRRSGERDYPCQERWCWSDALFMAPPVWAELSAHTGDPRYLEHSDKEFWVAANYLYDPEEHLFYRDSRFFERRDDSGGKIFWSRGNGWVMAGVARMLDSLPPDHESRPRYERLLREMAARLVQLQADDGYWSVSLLGPSATPETSGTAFFTYGLAWGVNNCVLAREPYAAAAERGWQALAAAVDSSGRLGWVQQVGYAPDEVLESDTQLYGTGALLLAAVEMEKLRTRTC
ncbi:MAG: glycoside hydrolase family 88 protein [Brevundimonas sp.]